MERMIAAIQFLLTFVESNPPTALIVFLVSAIANVVQIGTWIGDRRKIKREAAERARLSTLVATYEDVLKIAREAVQDKERLAALKDQIRSSAEEAGRLEERAQLLERAAKQRLVTQVIEYHRSVLRGAYEEVQRLKQENEALGELRPVPEDIRFGIESEIEQAVRPPHELPRKFVFGATLLVLLVLVVPWPIDALLLPMFAKMLLEASVQIVKLLDLHSARETMRRHWRVLSLLAVYGIWFGALRAVLEIVEQLSLGLLPRELSFLAVPLAFMIAFTHWQALRRELRDLVRRNLDPASQNVRVAAAPAGTAAA